MPTDTDERLTPEAQALEVRYLEVNEAYQDGEATMAQRRAALDDFFFAVVGKEA